MDNRWETTFGGNNMGNDTVNKVVEGVNSKMEETTNALVDSINQVLEEIRGIRSDLRSITNTTDKIETIEETIEPVETISTPVEEPVSVPEIVEPTIPVVPETPVQPSVISIGDLLNSTSNSAPLEEVKVDVLPDPTISSNIEDPLKDELEIKPDVSMTTNNESVMPVSNETTPINISFDTAISEKSQQRSFVASEADQNVLMGKQTKTLNLAA